MATYLSPGVYVEEKPSEIKPITGVGTSTAGFIGFFGDNINVPKPDPKYDPTKPISPPTSNASTSLTGTITKVGTLYAVRGSDGKDYSSDATTPKVVPALKATDQVVYTLKPDSITVATIRSKPDPVPSGSLTGEITKVGTLYAVRGSDGKDYSSDATTPKVVPELRATDQVVYTLKLDNITVATIKSKQDEPTSASSEGDITKIVGAVYTVKDLATGKEYSSDPTMNIEDVSLKVGTRVEYTPSNETSTFTSVKKSTKNAPFFLKGFTPREPGKVVLCTNFTEFREAFGDFSTDPGQRSLAHGVYGFFQNGGRRAWVAREKDKAQIDHVLRKFEGLDEIALVVAPGVCDQDSQEALLTHCEKLGERFAILDTPEEVGDPKAETPDVQRLISGDRSIVPRDSNYGAVYFPWIEISDPATKFQKPEGSGRIYIGPSGHVAGIYARVDEERGVHKAPANETVRDALDLRYYISKEHQASLNPIGVNCLRDINGAIRVWGARTLGGDRQNEWKYVNIRRTFLYLRESIDEGTQWVVFEPNDRMLWGKIVRNVSAFLSNMWRDGALFGSTAQEAFYVKCDDETNPQSIREQGQVVTEVGVALTRPAEFVVFHVSQWAGPQK